ncbi:MAG: hypothetical protein AB7U83_15905 [Vicinamibacterales bacterium]
MRLTLQTVRERSRAIAGEYPGAVAIDGVARSAGGSEYVEILVTLTVPGRADRQVMLDLPRTDGAAFERELRRRLTRLVGARSR